MNNLKTFVLMGALVALFGLVGQLVGGSQGLVFALLFGSLFNFIMYFFSDRLVLRMYGAQVVTEAQAPELYRMVDRLRQRAGLPMPVVAVAPHEQPNAFATGRSPRKAVVAVTTGILKTMPQEELEGVIAHELAHIKNRDMLIATVAAGIAGALSNLPYLFLFGGGSDDEGGHPFAQLALLLLAPIGALLIQMAVSRQREFEADRVGALILGRPMPLAHALVRLDAMARRIPMQVAPAAAPLAQVNPLAAHGGGIARMFSTHPPTEERVARLEAMAAGRQLLGELVGHHGAAVWLGFTGLVAALLILDLGVLNRRSHVLSFKEALSWSLGLITFAHLFGVFILWREGTGPALEYYTGYLIELSLSVDNLFVFILIFSYFGVPAEAQPKILKWGILGAIIMRLIFIALGALLLERFEWIIYVFGAILVITGFRMMRDKEDVVELEHNPVVRLARKILPFSNYYDGTRFFTRRMDGRVLATPMLLVLLVVEWSDLVFAIDSIPAIFAITRDPFLVYSSNVFAILGLRALFFVLAGMMDKFAYLKPGVAIILIFVGLKMTLSHWVHVPTLLSLAVIVLTLAGAVLLSLRRSAREARQPA